MLVLAPFEVDLELRSQVNRRAPRTDRKKKAAVKVGTVQRVTAVTVTVAVTAAVSRAVVATVAMRSLTRAAVIPRVINQEDECYSVLSLHYRPKQSLPLRR